MSVATGSIAAMDPAGISLIVLTLAALLLIGGSFFGGWFASSRSSERRLTEAAETVRVASELAVQRARLDAEAGAQMLREELAAAETRVIGLQDRLRDAREYDAARQRAEQEDHQVLRELGPLKAGLGKLEQTVTVLEQQRAAQHGELTEQLRASGRAEERLRGTAESLASALRSNTTRGLWGETQLRRLIESAGMLERVDFTVQHTLSGENGALRPDVIIHLPGGKSIALDAKVPFDSYLEAQSLTEQGDPAIDGQRDALLSKHAKALRDHVTTLSGRAYWSALPDSPELVVAYLPSEPLLSSALESDPTLLEFAFERRVALASPVSLWAILKSVAHTWRQESLTAEARTLFELGRELHTRFGKTADHLDKLGRTLSRGVQDYNAFVGSLERQVLPTARKISALNGEKLASEPSELDTAVRPLVAPELVVGRDRDSAPSE